MADKIRKPSSIATLKATSPAVTDAFLKLRAAVVAESTLDPKTQELILLAGYVVGRQEGGFRTHAARAMENGATLADVKTAVLLTFGGQAPVESVADALGWADDLAT